MIAEKKKKNIIVKSLASSFRSESNRFNNFSNIDVVSNIYTTKNVRQSCSVYCIIYRRIVIYNISERPTCSVLIRLQRIFLTTVFTQQQQQMIVYDIYTRKRIRNNSEFPPGTVVGLMKVNCRQWTVYIL